MINESHIPSGSIQTHNTVPTMNTPNTNPQIQTVRATPEVTQYIRSVVQEALREQNQPTVWTDEVILDRENLADLDRTPDIVRFLRDFSGNPQEYTAWRKSVDQIHELYGHLRGKAKYFGIISVIRSKVIGAANTALESHNTPLNWDAIKYYLNVHYADKRDIGTLEYQLTTMVQGKSRLEDFYHRVFSHLSLIINNISSLGLNKITENEFIDSYRNKALDTFVRGLNGDLPRLLAMKEPTDLPQALHLCTKLANQDFRASYANQRNAQLTPNLFRHPTNNQRQFALPNNQQFVQFNRQPINISRSIPNNLVQSQLPMVPQQFTNHQNPIQNHQGYNPQQFYQRIPPQNIQAPPRPIAPKPMNYEPMEVDHSIHSRMINYANRPQNQPPQNKRQISAPPSGQHAPKYTRNFHVDTTAPIENFYNPEPCYSTEMENNMGETREQSFRDYMQLYDNQFVDSTENSELIDVSDIHFLD